MTFKGPFQPKLFYNSKVPLGSAQDEDIWVGQDPTTNSSHNKAASCSQISTAFYCSSSSLFLVCNPHFHHVSPFKKLCFWKISALISFTDNKRRGRKNFTSWKRWKQRRGQENAGRNEEEQLSSVPQREQGEEIPRGKRTLLGKLPLAQPSHQHNLQGSQITGGVEKNMQISHVESAAWKRFKTSSHFSLGSSIYTGSSSVRLREKRKRQQHAQTVTLTLALCFHTALIWLTHSISLYRLNIITQKHPLLFLWRVKTSRFTKSKNERS